MQCQCTWLSDAYTFEVGIDDDEKSSNRLLTQSFFTPKENELILVLKCCGINLLNYDSMCRPSRVVNLSQVKPALRVLAVLFLI